MSITRHFTTFTAARSNLRGVFDAARAGVVTVMGRDGERFVVASARDRAVELRHLLTSGAVVVAEGGGWSALLPGVPVHGDAGSFDAALDDLVVALREYAEDWNDHLHHVPNHAAHRSLVELVELSEDDELRAWLVSDVGQGSSADERSLA